MATDREFIAYVMEQADLGTRLTSRKMFGEYALYVDDKVVAFACDNSVFLKRTAAAAKHVPDAPERPPYPGAKDYPVIDELLDDGDLLRGVLLDTAELLPTPKPQAARKAPRKAITAAAAPRPKRGK